MISEEKPVKRLVSLNTVDCLWMYILRILLDKPMHAYAIRKKVEERFGFKPGTVTAYKVLYLLKKEGYVKSRKEDRITNYEITARGRKILQEARKFYERQLRILR